MHIPLTKPNPAKLSECLSSLHEIEERAVFTNFGPQTSSFEQKIVSQVFGGIGECLTLCNATMGLILAIRQTIEDRPKSRRRYALMPSFTFAAAAQAARWNRLTPLFCDINPTDWAADADSERQMIEKYHKDIAVIVPYATFGYDIDLQRYEDIQRHYGIPVVVDAAASLGTISADGRGFGTGFSGTVVFSMHATKSFATSEGGLVYSANPQLIRILRSMSNFGFSEPRNATHMGLNGKMSEVTGLLANLRLATFDSVVERRSSIMQIYRDALPEVTFQPRKPNRQSHQFTSTLLPKRLAAHRSAIQDEILSRDIASATYFSPHVAQQDYFRGLAKLDSLPITNDIAARILTLPLFDTMTNEEVQQVVSAAKAAFAVVEASQSRAGLRKSGVGLGGRPGFSQPKNLSNNSRYAL